MFTGSGQTVSLGTFTNPIIGLPYWASIPASAALMAAHGFARAHDQDATGPGEHFRNAQGGVAKRAAPTPQAALRRLRHSKWRLPEHARFCCYHA